MSLPLILGITIPLVLISIIAVVALVLWKRKRRAVDTQKPRPKSDDAFIADALQKPNATYQPFDQREFSQQPYTEFIQQDSFHNTTISSASPRSPYQQEEPFYSPQQPKDPFYSPPNSTTRYMSTLPHTDQDDELWTPKSQYTPQQNPILQDPYQQESYQNHLIQQDSYQQDPYQQVLHAPFSQHSGYPSQPHSTHQNLTRAPSNGSHISHKNLTRTPSNGSIISHQNLTRAPSSGSHFSQSTTSQPLPTPSRHRAPSNPQSRHRAPSTGSQAIPSYRHVPQPIQPIYAPALRLPAGPRSAGVQQTVEYFDPRALKSADARMGETEDPRSWTAEDVGEWLILNGVGEEVGEMFKEHGIDGRQLGMVTDDLLIQMGVRDRDERALVVYVIGKVTMNLF